MSMEVKPFHILLNLHPLPLKDQSQKNVSTSPRGSSYLENRNVTWEYINTWDTGVYNNHMEETASYVSGSWTECVWNWGTDPASSAPRTRPRFSTISPPARCSGHSETAVLSRLAGTGETSGRDRKLTANLENHAIHLLCWYPAQFLKYIFSSYFQFK